MRPAPMFTYRISFGMSLYINEGVRLRVVKFFGFPRLSYVYFNLSFSSLPFFNLLTSFSNPGTEMF